MSRRRYISTDISTDKRLNKLADFPALLYTWMVPHAADDATLNGDVEEFMAIVLPMRRDKTIGDVESALAALCCAGLIQWDGKTIYFPVEAFYRYQTYIKVENRRTANIDLEQHPSRKNAEEQRETPEKAVSLSPSLSLSPSVSPSVSSADVPPAKRITDDFREEMAIEFPDLDEGTEFERATNHIAYRKAIDKRLYYRNWLKNARKFAAERNGNGRAMGTGANAHGRGSNPQDDPELKRLRALGIIAE